MGPERNQKYLAIFAGASFAAAFVWLWVSAGAAERNAIGSLPEPERRALYQRTLNTLASTCDLTKRPSGLENFCREQAALIVNFPECDEACTALSKDHLPAPTR